MFPGDKKFSVVNDNSFFNAYKKKQLTNPFIRKEK